MSLLCKAVVFNITTQAATSTVVVTGVGFLPKAILFLSTGRTESTDAGGNQSAKRMFGFAGNAGGTTKQRVVASMDEGATAVPTSNKHMGRSDCCILSIELPTNTVDGRASLTTFDSDGFTLTIDDAFSASHRIIALCFGGTDLTDVQIGHVSEATGTPPYNQDVTGLGFTGADNQTVGFVFGARCNTDGVGLASSDLQLGVFTSPTQQATWSGGARDGNTSVTQAASLCHDVRCWSDIGSSFTLITARAQFVSWIAGGFRWQWDEIAAALPVVYYMVLNGGRWAVKPGATSVTLDADVVVTGAGVGTPVGGLVVSGVGTETADDAVVAHDKGSFGIFSGVADRYAVAQHQVDNVATSVVANRVEHDLVYANIDSDGALVGGMDVQSLDADGVTFNMDDGDAAANFFWTLLAGSASTSINVPVTGVAATASVGAVAVSIVNGIVLYPIDSVASGSNYGDSQQGGSPPTLATTGTGWTVSTIAAGNYSRMDFGVERVSGTFGATSQPSGAPDNTLGDSFRAGPFNGTFAAGNWGFSFMVRAVTSAGGQDGRFRVRVWKSANADGSSPVELTAGSVAMSTVTDLLTTADQVSSVIIALGEQVFSNEYLFVQLAWEITGAAA